MRYSSIKDIIDVKYTNSVILLHFYTYIGCQFGWPYRDRKEREKGLGEKTMWNGRRIKGKLTIATDMSLVFYVVQCMANNLYVATCISMDIAHKVMNVTEN